MPRVARVVVPGGPHHLTQRGNNRQDVFFTDDDRRFYLETLKQHSERFGFEVGLLPQFLRKPLSMKVTGREEVGTLIATDLR